MTGNIQKMTEAVHVHFTKGLQPAELRGAVLLLCTWVGYVVGGILGAALSTCAGTFCASWSLTPVVRDLPESPRISPNLPLS